MVAAINKYCTFNSLDKNEKVNQQRQILSIDQEPKQKQTTSIKSSHLKCLSLLYNGKPEIKSLAAAGGGRHGEGGRGRREAEREVKWASVSGC